MSSVTTFNQSTSTTDASVSVGGVKVLQLSGLDQEQSTLRTNRDHITYPPSSSPSSVTEISIEFPSTSSPSSSSSSSDATTHCKELSEPLNLSCKNNTNLEIKFPDTSISTPSSSLSNSAASTPTALLSFNNSEQVLLDSHSQSSRLPKELSSIFSLDLETTEADSQSLRSPSMDISAIHPVVKSFVVGSISGTCSTVIFQPLDLLKTRLQNPPNIVGRGHGMFAVVGHIVRDEKLLGLWRGMTPSLTRCVPGVGLYFGSIHGLKIAFDINSEPTAVQSILLGATARSISGVTMIPFTVIKTRFESKVYHYGGIREAITVIYQKEGVRGLTCGLVPTLLRDAPFSALYLMMYTWTKRRVPKEWIESGSWSPYVRFSCGIFAGVGASLVTQPFDVVKTKMQLFPDRFNSIPPVLRYIYEKYGMAGYFKGLMPRMVRRTLIAAMSWTVYEQLMRNMGLK